jgi:TPR repeat protein
MVLLFGVATFTAYRLVEYRHHEPMREGISAWKAGDTTAALQKLRPFAESGDVLAQTILGEIYAYGQGLPVDVVLAGMWFRRAECRSGVPGGHEYAVSQNYLAGRAPGPVKQDARAAERWLQRAAEAGHKEAQRILAEPTKLSELGLSIDPAVSDYWKRHTR